MYLGSTIKAVTDVRDYDVDFSEWLDPSDEIATATASSDMSTLTVESVSNTASTVKVWLSGGQSGTADVNVTATTNNGRVKTVCFKLKIRESC